MAQAAERVPGRRAGAFEKLEEKAAFIYGEDLVMDVVRDDGTAALAVSTLWAKADGLSAVMVLPNGDVYESRMKPEDAAAVEAAWGHEP